MNKHQSLWSIENQPLPAQCPTMNQKPTNCMNHYQSTWTSAAHHLAWQVLEVIQHLTIIDVLMPINHLSPPTSSSSHKKAWFPNHCWGSSLKHHEAIIQFTSSSQPLSRWFKRLKLTKPGPWTIVSPSLPRSFFGNSWSRSSLAIHRPPFNQPYLPSVDHGLAILVGGHYPLQTINRPSSCGGFSK